jgi:hypothetical protein
MTGDFNPRRPRREVRASGWDTVTICGTSLMVPTALDDDGLRSVLTSGVDWEQAFNLTKIPGEMITSWVAGIARYGSMQFLIDDLLPSAGAYCMTGKRGSGKTSVAVTLAMHVACGAPIWGRKVKLGRVLYLAGENPPDVMRRIEETSEQSGLRPHDKALLVSHGVRDPMLLLSEVDRIGQETGLFDLVIVDTHQSHYCGDDFNDNAQMAAMAKSYLALAEAQGGTVLVLSHPNRMVSGKSDLVPAGGGAFLNQLDGNYTIERNGTEIELHWSEKLRAPDFEPVFLDQVKIAFKSVPWGQIKSPTVVAQPLSPNAMYHRRQDEALVDVMILCAIGACVKAKSTTNIAEELAHTGGNAMTAKQLGAHLTRLLKAGHISKSGRGSGVEWSLEPTGKTKTNGVTSPKINGEMVPLI